MFIFQAVASRKSNASAIETQAKLWARFSKLTTYKSLQLQNDFTGPLHVKIYPNLSKVYPKLAEKIILKSDSDGRMNEGGFYAMPLSSRSFLEFFNSIGDVKFTFTKEGNLGIVNGRDLVIEFFRSENGIANHVFSILDNRRGVFIDSYHGSADPTNSFTFINKEGEEEVIRATYPSPNFSEYELEARRQAAIDLTKKTSIRFIDLFKNTMLEGGSFIIDRNGALKLYDIYDVLVAKVEAYDATPLIKNCLDVLFGYLTPTALDR